MKITPKRLVQTADISSARGKQATEFVKLMLFGAGLILAVLLGIGFLADWLVARIDPAKEAAAFGSFFSGHGIASKELPEDLRARADQAELLLERLRHHPSVLDLPYRMRYLQEDRPNAIAFPGGLICVTTGLLRQIDGEVPLAFVIGHELGHYRNRDHLRGLGRALGIATALSLIFGDGNAAGLADKVGGAAQLGYSRGQEQRADRFGLLLVHESLGKTEGATRLFEILSGSGQLPSWAYMMSTHPAHQKRISLLRDYARTLGPAPLQAVEKPR